MSEAYTKQDAACGGGCTQCSLGDRPPAPGELAGWRLARTTICIFLFPLGLAIAGATIARGSAVAEFLGALGGLAAGAILTAVAARCIRRSCKETE